MGVKRTSREHAPKPLGAGARPVHPILGSRARDFAVMHNAAADFQGVPVGPVP
jgi:hypothetical protein